MYFLQFLSLSVCQKVKYYYTRKAVNIVAASAAISLAVVESSLLRVLRPLGVDQNSSASPAITIVPAPRTCLLFRGIVRFCTRSLDTLHLYHYRAPAPHLQ